MRLVRGNPSSLNSRPLSCWGELMFTVWPMDSYRSTSTFDIFSVKSLDIS